MRTKRNLALAATAVVAMAMSASGRDADDELLRSVMNLDRPGGCADADGFWNASDRVVDYIKTRRPLTEAQREAVDEAIVALIECRPRDAGVMSILQGRERKLQEESAAAQERLDARRACMETRFERVKSPAGGDPTWVVTEGESKTVVGAVEGERAILTLEDMHHTRGRNVVYADEIGLCRDL